MAEDNHRFQYMHVLSPIHMIALLLFRCLILAKFCYYLNPYLTTVILLPSIGKFIKYLIAPELCLLCFCMTLDSTALIPTAILRDISILAY